MKKIIVSCLFVLCSCGEQNPPVPGLYDLTNTYTSINCVGSGRSVGDTEPLVVDIVKDGGEYILYMCDEQGNHMLQYGTSRDGHTFSATVSGAFIVSTCTLTQTATFNIDYDKDKSTRLVTASGVGHTSLTMSQSCGGQHNVCEWDTSFTGTRRIGAIVSE